MQRGFSLVLILVVLGVLCLIGGVSFYLFNKQQISAINSFDECAKKYPILESYPAKCNTPDGKHFVQEILYEDPVISSESGQFQNPEGVKGFPGNMQDRYR